ncbi:MAG TPA: Ig-like domain-containing protein [Mycobacteriales bacterium]|nr:Ig-like domain-containing protein [Mycobacteriales bacterium]
MTITSHANSTAGGDATINGTYTPAAGAGGTAPSIEYTIQGATPSSAATATFPNGTPCNTNGTVNLDGTFTCTVHNGGTAGSEDIRVFADNDADNVYKQSAPAEPSDTVTLVFSGAPQNITLSPSGASSAATDTCTAYTAHVVDANGNPAAGQTVVLHVDEAASSTPGANPISLYEPDCSDATPTPGGSAAGNAITYTHNFTVPSNGDVKFGLASSAPGAATITVQNTGGTVISNAATVTYSQGGTNSVASLAVTSANTQTGFVNSTQSFTVKATDSSGNPVQGVAVMEETTGTSVDTLAPTSCGTTNSSGNVTCSITNGGTAGTDHLTFWVNNSTGTPRTNGPDSGEPQATATAVFNAQPAVSSANSTLTCVQQLAGTDQGKAKTDCTVPVSQHSVTFTATVRDASNNPIANQPVSFTATSAKLGGATVTGANLPSGTSNTDANGKATFVVNDPSAANGDNVTVHAAVGAKSVGTASAHWAAAAASALNVTPPLQSVTKGGTVTVHVQVVDQFGTATAVQSPITFTVAGRNNGVSGAAVNGTITYTDTGVNSASDTDTITVNDALDSLSGTAKVKYVTGPITPSAVTLDTSGSGTSDATCAAAGHTPATDVNLGATTEVCAVVKNANNEALAGQAVTFTVNNGQVDTHGNLSDTSTKTVQATTDEAGVAFADVTSTTSGAQTVTATAGSATDSDTVTYKTAPLASAYTIALSPADPTVAPGGTQKFTATVTDKFGNPVAGVSVGFTQQGPGSLSGTSSASVTTGADGTASVTLITQVSDSGSGSVTATINTTGTQCSSAPNATPPSTCTATSTYTVATTGAATLSLDGEHGANVGTHETVRATAKNADGTPAANQIVRFFVSGANSATGSTTTDAAGNAKFVYALSHHGKDTIAAYVDSNNDQIRQASEPKDTIVRHIQGIEHPKLTLHSNNGKVKAHVNTRPNAKHALVRYYVKRHGSWHKIGSSHTNRHGNDNHKFAFKVGSHHKFRAKVSATAVTTKGTSNKESIRVRG